MVSLQPWAELRAREVFFQNQQFFDGATSLNWEKSYEPSRCSMSDCAQHKLI